MILTSLVGRIRWCFALNLATMFLCVAVGRADDPKPARPSTEGRPVYLVNGTAVIFPKGVEKPTEGYKGALGVSPLAVIKIDDKIVGEVYSSALEGSSVEEAKEMAASADKSDKIELKKKATLKLDGRDFETVTLKMNLKSSLGTPWIVHSVYIPRGKASATFKLVVSEEQFKTLLPYLETMLSLDRFDTKRK
jgi:hypothetical protein